jgi:hypothetical protein
LSKYERKQEMREKYLQVPPGWILGTIKRELNASGGDMLEDRHDHHEMALAYWRQNRRQYPLARLWDIFYYDLLFKSELGSSSSHRSIQKNRTKKAKMRPSMLVSIL